MKFLSTRGQAPPVTFGTALLEGLAPDGGLYVPERFPSVDWSTTDELSLGEAAHRLLAPFFEGDPLAPKLPGILERAFDFPIPLTPLQGRNGSYVLELFHGPTAAFKDVGARFMAECLSLQDRTPRTVLVATSGDTGSAVAAALDRKENLEVIVLFPKGGVSEEQLSLIHI